MPDPPTSTASTASCKPTPSRPTALNFNQRSASVLQSGIGKFFLPVKLQAIFQSGYQKDEQHAGRADGSANVKEQPRMMEQVSMRAADEHRQVADSQQNSQFGGAEGPE